MQTKGFFASKINWTAIILILISLQDAITNLDLSKMDVKSWITFAIGVGVIILRTWFTNTSIKTPEAPAKSG